MPKGLITSLLIKLTIDYWYFTLIALLIKLFLLRFIASVGLGKSIIIWLIGSITFFVIACIAGIIFSSTGFYYTPFIMFICAFSGELLFCSVMFRTPARKLVPSMLIGDGIFFALLFTQML